MRLFNKWSKMTIDELADDFILDVAANKAAATVRNYKWRLKRFVDEFGGKSPRDIRKAHLQTFIIQLRENKEIRDSSINATVQGVKRFFSWLKDEGYIDKEIHQAISQSEPKDLIEDKATDAQTMRLMLDATPYIRDRVIIKFMADSGARRGEVARLLIKNLNFDNLTALVNGKVGSRIITYTPPSVEMLRDYLRNHRPDVDHGYVFCTLRAPYAPMNPSVITKMHWRVAERLKAQGADLGRTNPHSIRHWVAQQYNAEGDIYLAKQKLGHKSLQTTLAYVRNDVSQVQARDSQLTVLNSLLDGGD